MSQVDGTLRDLKLCITFISGSIWIIKSPYSLFLALVVVPVVAGSVRENV